MAADDRNSAGNDVPKRRRIAGEGSTARAKATKPAVAAKPAPRKSAAQPKPKTGASESSTNKSNTKKSGTSKSGAAKSSTPESSSPTPSAAKTRGTKGAAQSVVGQAVARRSGANSSHSNSAVAQKTAKTETLKTNPTPAKRATPSADSVKSWDRGAPLTTKLLPSRLYGSTATRIAIACVALAMGIAVLAWGVVERFDGPDDREEAVAAASAGVEAILSYRYTDLEAHHKEAMSVMTPSYADDYREQTAPTLDETAPQRKVSIEAVVRRAATVPCGRECSADKVSVLMFVDSDRRIEGQESAEVSGNRLVVDLERNDSGEWKIADILGV